MNTFPRLRLLAGLFATAMIFILFASTSSAQVTSGNIAGTVKDATGAAIPHANIALTNLSTGATTNATSTGAGDFLIQNLPAAKYDLKVTASGFAPSVVKGVSVDLNTTATANVAMAPGSSSTTVEVDADASAMLDTTTQNLTTTFSNTELSELPTSALGGALQNGVLNVSLLSPGVASSGGLGIGVGPSIGGQRPRNNNFTIEGIDNNNKAVTGPLVYLPNDAVGNFTLITNQFSPEFGHSSGGQFNTTAVSGTNHFHGKIYEYFQNRNLNAASGIAGGKIPNPKYDNNRYGGQVGGPVLHEKLFFFANYERNTLSQNQSGYVCAPTAAGRTLLSNNAAAFSATNLAQYLKYVPVANFNGGAQVNDGNDNACFSGNSGPQVLSVTGTAGAVNIPLGNYQINASDPTTFWVLSTSADYNISQKDSLRVRYIYNNQVETDTSTGISLPVFYTTEPFKYHLVAISEYHTFTPNLTNEFRVGFNRYDNTLGAGNFSYPGLDSFPTFQFYDQGFITVGPDGNAPQFTIQNLYQATDNISWTKGKHTIKMGFDGRKYISPQGFTQRARGDYEYNTLNEFLQDLAPDKNGFAERSSGSHTYYGDQTALYGYANDTYRITPQITINAGLRYEFTSVPIGERAQALNSVSSVAGLIDFHAPKPSYTGWAPRVGIEYAPNAKTSVRLGFGIAYDVLFDNLGTLSFPPQFSVTEDVGTTPGFPYSKPKFLAGGGLPPGTGSGVTTYATPALARAATSAFLPDQVLPYTETYTATVQHTFGTNYTGEIGYVGTRGIHLPTQDQINVRAIVTAANRLPTVAGGTLIQAGGSSPTLATLTAMSNIVPAYAAAGFTSKITSYQPYSSSNYNGLVMNLTRRLQHGLQMNLSYTWSKTMDDATDEVFATVLTPRRPQDSQCVACDYSRSALDRTHRVSLEAIYDVPFYKTSSNFLMRNIAGNWLISPIYTYESPEYATALSGYNANLNGDSGAAIDRPLINPNGIKGTGTDAIPIVNPALQGTCSASATPYSAANGNGAGLYTACDGDTIGYSAGQLSNGGQPGATFTPVTNAYYVAAGPGTLPTASRNTLPIRPINNFDVALYKRISFMDHYAVEFGAQAFNLLNHPQYVPGSVDNVNGPSYTSAYNFQTVSSGAFNRPDKEFLNNARTMQLTGKFSF